MIFYFMHPKFTMAILSVKKSKIKISSELATRKIYKEYSLNKVHYILSHPLQIQRARRMRPDCFAFLSYGTQRGYIPGLRTVARFSQRGRGK